MGTDFESSLYLELSKMTFSEKLNFKAGFLSIYRVYYCSKQRITL